LCPGAPGGGKNRARKLQKNAIDKFQRICRLRASEVLMNRPLPHARHATRAMAARAVAARAPAYAAFTFSFAFAAAVVFGLVG
jgi:hypothetical protein